MSRVIAGAYENSVVSANMIYLSEEDLELRRKELAASGKRLSLQDKKLELSSSTVAKFEDKGLMGNGEHLLEVFFTDERQCLLSLGEGEYQAVLKACAGKGKPLQESSFDEQVKPRRTRSRSTSAHSASAATTASAAASASAANTAGSESAAQAQASEASAAAPHRRARRTANSGSGSGSEADTAVTASGADTAANGSRQGRRTSSPASRQTQGVRGGSGEQRAAGSGQSSTREPQLQAQPESHWWHNRFFVIVMLILAFPIGLGFLWASPRFSTLTKAVVSVFVMLALNLAYDDIYDFSIALLLVSALAGLIYVWFSSRLSVMVKLLAPLVAFVCVGMGVSTLKDMAGDGVNTANTSNTANVAPSQQQQQSQQQGQSKSASAEKAGKSESNTLPAPVKVVPQKQSKEPANATDEALRRKIASGAIHPLTKKNSPEIYRNWGRSYVERINKELMTKAALAVAESDQCNAIIHVGLDNERSTVKQNAVFDVLCLNGNRFYVSEKDMEEGTKAGTKASTKASTKVKPHKDEDKGAERIAICEKAAKQRLKRPDTFERRPEPALLKSWGSDNYSVTFGFTVNLYSGNRKVDMYARCMFNRHGLYEVKVNQGRI